jgi:hypothetical protein
VIFHEPICCVKVLIAGLGLVVDIWNLLEEHERGEQIVILAAHFAKQLDGFATFRPCRTKVGDGKRRSQSCIFRRPLEALKGLLAGALTITLRKIMAGQFLPGIH